jgi:hypothetical protein
VAVAGGLAIAGVGGALANRWGLVWLALVAWGALVAGGGLAAVVRAWELRVRTPWGCDLWLRVESFRQFLAGPQAHHLEEAAKRGVLGQYAAWAVAVGEIDRWSRVVAASAWYADDRYSDMARRLPRDRPPPAADQPPSSGGSSGGGGSSSGSSGSGGGGGGGGGGSW